MEQLKLDLDTWFGKTCREHSAQTGEKISAQCLKKRCELSIKTPLYLDLRAGSGGIAGVSWETDSPSLGEYSTRSFGECPSAAVESRLSQILEEEAHSKYFLGGRACKGVLRRAEARGKKLPPLLKEVLEKQSGLTIWREVRREAWEQKENGAKRFERAGTERRCVIL